MLNKGGILHIRDRGVVIYSCRVSDLTWSQDPFKAATHFETTVELIELQPLASMFVVRAAEAKPNETPAEPAWVAEVATIGTSLTAALEEVAARLDDLNHRD